MRSKEIPDDYVGDTHLTNWFKKHLEMKTLKRVYLHSKEDNRTDVKKCGVKIMPQSRLYLEFNSGNVITIISLSYTNFVDCFC